MSEKVYTVSEAVRLIGVESHVLRYWEEELDISIERTSQGHRVYSQKNVETFCRVKELREEGLQLKAIRRVLDQAEGKSLGQPDFQEFCSDFPKSLSAGDVDALTAWNLGDTGDEADVCMAQEETNGCMEPEKLDSCVEPEEPDYEIILTEEPTDGLEQFVAVLKKIMEEVVREQNEKLEQALEECIQDKMEELYLQYFQMMQEAAASREAGKNQEGILRRILHRLLGR